MCQDFSPAAPDGRSGSSLLIRCTRLPALSIEAVRTTRERTRPDGGVDVILTVTRAAAVMPDAEVWLA